MGDKKTTSPVDSKLCTGCGLCSDICPTQAISMQPDAILGHLRPQININQCMNCGLCERKCPCANPVDKYQIQEAYAAWAKEDDKHYSSSSGGIASIIYEYTIREGGVIAGVQMKGVSHPTFECSDSMQIIETFKRSKYIQVDHNGIYKAILKELKAGRFVAFIGLPCQCAAMKRIAEGIDENLLLVDLVCHGTPSFKVFSEYVYAITQSPDVEVSFRDPKKGVVLSIYKDGNAIYNRTMREDPYLTAFMEGNLFAECCYNCIYACENRVGDFTIGDFWGLGEKVPFDYKVSRVSAVLINSDKGRYYFDKLSKDIKQVKRDAVEAINGNNQLQKPSKKGANRDIVISSISNGNSAGDIILKLYGKTTNKVYKKRVLKATVKRIGKALGLKKIKDLIKG